MYRLIERTLRVNNETVATMKNTLNPSVTPHKIFADVPFKPVVLVSIKTNGYTLKHATISETARFRIKMLTMTRR